MDLKLDTVKRLPSKAAEITFFVKVPFFIVMVASLASRSTLTWSTLSNLLRVARTLLAQPPHVIPLTPTTYFTASAPNAADAHSTNAIGKLRYNFFMTGFLQWLRTVRLYIG